MTTHILIKSVDDGGGHDVVVNVIETSSPRSEVRAVERHDLKPGDSVTVRVWGWGRYLNILDAALADPQHQD